MFWHKSIIWTFHIQENIDSSLNTKSVLNTSYITQYILWIFSHDINHRCIHMLQYFKQTCILLQTWLTCLIKSETLFGDVEITVATERGVIRQPQNTLHWIWNVTASYVCRNVKMLKCCICGLGNLITVIFSFPWHVSWYVIIVCAMLWPCLF